MPLDEQIELIDAHPRLGALARGGLGAVARREQAAGADRRAPSRVAARAAQRGVRGALRVPLLRLRRRPAARGAAPRHGGRARGGPRRRRSSARSTRSSTSRRARYATLTRMIETRSAQPLRQGRHPPRPGRPRPDGHRAPRPDRRDRPRGRLRGGPHRRRQLARHRDRHDEEHGLRLRQGRISTARSRTTAGRSPSTSSRRPRSRARPSTSGRITGPDRRRRRAGARRVRARRRGHPDRDDHREPGRHDRRGRGRGPDRDEDDALGVQRLPARPLHDAARDRRSAHGHQGHRDLALRLAGPRLGRAVRGRPADACSTCSPTTTARRSRPRSGSWSGRSSSATPRSRRSDGPAEPPPLAGRPDAVRAENRGEIFSPRPSRTGSSRRRSAVGDG